MKYLLRWIGMCIGGAFADYLQSNWTHFDELLFYTGVAFVVCWICDLMEAKPKT